MNVVVGTTSKRKVETIKKTLIDFAKQENINVVPFSVSSSVSETPWDKETFEGAKNRAVQCKKKVVDADYWVGVESGLVERYGHVYEEAWCCVLSKNGKEYFGYSSGLKVPDFLLNQMKEHNLPHYLIFAKLNNHHEKDINSDTWGQYSGNMILRELGLVEALRNAFVQIFAPKTSYYHK